jgi:hypothetical protein
MATDDPGARPLWRLTSPACRVICLAGTDEIKSVAVWSPDRHRYWAVRPDAAELNVLRGFAEQVAGEIVASVRPAGGGGVGAAGVSAAGVSAAGVSAAGVSAAGVSATGVSATGTSLPAEAAALSAEGATLLPIAQELTDPRLLVCRVVGVMAQIAAVHVGFSPTVAEMIGRLAGSLASRLTEAEPESQGTRVLQYADVTFSAAGELTEHLGVGRVEIRSRAEATRRLRALDRDPPPSRSRTTNPPPSRSRTTNRIRLVQALPERQVLRAARLPGVSPAVRGPQPGVSPVIRGLSPGVRSAVRGLPPGQGQMAERPLPGVGGSRRYRPPPRYRPGRRGVPSRGRVLGRDELRDRGEPPSRGGPPAR